MAASPSIRRTIATGILGLYNPPVPDVTMMLPGLKGFLPVLSGRTSREPSPRPVEMPATLSRVRRTGARFSETVRRRTLAVLVAANAYHPTQAHRAATGPT